LAGEIWGHFYWLRRRPSWKAPETNKQTHTLKQVSRLIKKLLKSGKAKPETTYHGSVLKRESFIYGNCPLFHKLYLGDGWVYFGGGWSEHFAYINESKMQLIEYCEGDVTITTSPDLQTFELEKIATKESVRD